MKTRIKTLVALGLVMAMATGCGSPAQKESEEISEVKDSTSAESTDNSSVEEESPYPDYLNLDSYRPIVKEDEEITLKVVTVRSPNATSDFEELWFPKFIEEKLNINLEVEVIAESDIDQKKSLIFASGELPDIFFGTSLSNVEISQYGTEDGMLLPISDYFSEELTPSILDVLEKYPEIKRDYTARDGKMYSIPKVGEGKPGTAGSVGKERLFINTERLKEIGMEESPKTVEEFVDTCRAYKALYPDNYPIVSDPKILYRYLRTAFGWVGGDESTYTWDEAEQKIVIPATTEKYADFLELFHTLYSEELIHPDHYTMDKTERRSILGEGNTLFTGDSAPYLFTDTDWDKYIMASPLTSDWVDTPISWRLPQFESVGGYISADTEYPELCVRLFDYLYTPEGSLYALHGPIAGTEDTLGMVEGLTLNEKGDNFAIDLQDALDKIRLFKNGSVYDEAGSAYAMEQLGGVASTVDGGLDLSDPDDHYLYNAWITQNDYLVDALPEPFITEELNARYSDYKTVISNHVNSETAKFVIGQRSLDEVDQFFKELKDMGSDEYIATIQEMFATYSR